MHHSLWSTPKGVISNAQEMGLIVSYKVITPSRWLVRELQSQVSIVERDEIRRRVESGGISSLSTYTNSDYDYIKLELASAYNQYEYHKGVISETTLVNNVQGINKIRSLNYSDKRLTSNDNSNPLNAPNDSQLTLSTILDSGKSSVALTFLPVSHMLRDDNRVYGHETELQIFGTTLKIPLQTGLPVLDRMNIYTVQSLLPRDVLTGGLSGRLSVAYEPQRNKYLDAIHAFVIGGALGVTERFVPDVDGYILGGGGGGYAKDGFYGYSTLETGLIVREKWGMKSLISFSNTMGQVDMKSFYNTLHVQQVKYLDKENTLNIEWFRYINQHGMRDQLLFNITKIF